MNSFTALRHARWRGFPCRRAWVFQGALAVGFMTLLGCSPLEPLPEPEMTNLQLTVDTLKTTIRENQRTIVELRAELEARRQELADVQIARAQLEGRVREAERRLVEARQVIDLQREELAGSRSERDRVTRSGAALHNQLKQLQQQLSKMGNETNSARAAAATPSSVPVPRRRTGKAPSDSTAVVVSPALHVSDRSTGTKPGSAFPTRVVVQPKDTLWSLAQRYGVPVKRLIALNHLADTHIQAGQVLWFSEPPPADDLGDEVVQ